MNHIANLRRIEDRMKSTIQFPRLVLRVVGLLHDDTGESGEAYDVEAKAEASARAQAAY